MKPAIKQVIDSLPEVQQSNIELPHVMKVVELIGIHDGKVVARMVVHPHPCQPGVPVKTEEHSLVAVKIIPMVEIIPELKFILAAQNQPQE